MRRGRSVAVAAFCLWLNAAILAGAAEKTELSGVESGWVEGVIRFGGEVPKSTVADDAGVHRDLLRVEPKTRGLKDVVVWLIATKAIVRGAAEKTEAAQMDQFAHEFVPRVLAVRAGQAVKFTNSDPANHNVRTSAGEKTNEFNIFTGVDGSYTHRFVAEKTGKPIRLGCDIHPWMRGWIYVFEHPYFAVTDERGKFRIDGVPAGEYEMVIAQPDIRHSEKRKVRVSGGSKSVVEMEISSKRVPE